MKKAAYIIMGVSGCGKTTIGKKLAETLNINFYDGDAFHPITNIEKMAAGIALTDEDRYSWLLDINRQIKKTFSDGNSVVFCLFRIERILSYDLGATGRGFDCMGLS